MALLSIVALIAVAGVQSPAKVQVLKGADGFTLTVDAKPFFIKGAGGDGPKPLLKTLGGNSWRTWGADNLDKQLDEAQKLGMKVTVGIWLGHTEHGFKYDDKEMVAKQYAEAVKVIEKYRNHPAVLMWGLGNEMEGYQQGDDPNVWNAVEAIAKEAKRLDPNHPTMTVIAEIGGKKVPSIHKYCPDIDIVGINSYAGAPSLADRYRQAGGTKPYVLTEFGPVGQWEAGKTPWGASLEATSTEKAAHYRESYEKAVAGAKGLCLGSYAFTWGYKQEETATWFGMLLPTGEKVNAADTMSELWTGKQVPNRCPAIAELKVDGSPEAAPGERIKVSLKVNDPDGDALKVRWVLHDEVKKRGVGGSTEATLDSYPNALLSGTDTGALVKLPNAPGAYRLFVYVTDGKGNAAVGNVPLNAK